MIVLKVINFCTKSEERARDSEKVHKKVQNRKNRRKGLILGAKFSKVKSIDGGLPSRIWAYFG